MLLGDLATVLIIIALVQTHMLRRFFRGLWPLHYDRLQGISQAPSCRADWTLPRPPQGECLALASVHCASSHPCHGPWVGTRGLSPRGALVIAPSTLCQVHSNPLRWSSTVSA